MPLLLNQGIHSINHPGTAKAGGGKRERKERFISKQLFWEMRKEGVFT